MKSRLDQSQAELRRQHHETMLKLKEINWSMSNTPWWRRVLDVLLMYLQDMLRVVMFILIKMTIFVVLLYLFFFHVLPLIGRFLLGLPLF